MALLIDNHSIFFGSNARNSSSCEVLYAASWICGEFSEHLQTPEDTLKALFRSQAIGSLPGHILSVYLQNGMKLFSYIAGKELKEDNSKKVKEIADYLEDNVLKDLVSSSDLEVQERASVMHHFLKYVTKHLDKNDDITADFEVFFAGELNPVALKAQKKVPIPEGLDLDAWINEPPPEESESEESEIDEPTKQDVFGIKGATANYESPSKINYVEPTKEELQKSRQARLAQQSSDPFYLKESSAKSPLRMANNVNDIPVQKIDLDLPLQTIGFTTPDQYLEMKNGHAKDSKKKKKKKKDKKKEQVLEEFEEEDETATSSVLVSTNIEMPEGVELDSDGNDSDDKTNDDPHRALGEINLDDLEYLERESPTRSVATNDDSTVPIQLFGETSIKKSKKKTEKVKKEKKEKKDKKKKKKKDNEHNNQASLISVPVTNGNENNDEDMDFWLSPSKQMPDQDLPSKVKDEKSPKNKKKKHKKGKHDVSSVQPKTNGIVTTSPLSLKTLAANDDFKMLYDVKRVPMDPDKMTAGISFINVGTNAIASVELDFVDTPNIIVIRDNPDKGIKVEMELGSGKTEDHLFLFNVS